MKPDELAQKMWSCVFSDNMKKMDNFTAYAGPLIQQLVSESRAAGRKEGLDDGAKYVDFRTGNTTLGDSVRALAGKK